MAKLVDGIDVPADVDVIAGKLFLNSDRGLRVVFVHCQDNIQHDNFWTLRNWSCDPERYFSSKVRAVHRVYEKAICSISGHGCEK